MKIMSNVLTCVYCGMAYPEGTPPSGAKILTDHIRVCPKHPMRELEEKYAKVRNALVVYVGVDGAKDLEGIRDAMRAFPETAEKAIAIIGIQALLETL